MTSALYATNVSHYDHVLTAMNEIFDEVKLARRAEIAPSQVETMHSLHLPNKMIELAARRMRVPSPIPIQVAGLGISQFLTPIATRWRLDLDPKIRRAIISRSAESVSRIAKKTDVLHFVEGLGHKAILQGSNKLNICEVRNFHYKVFREDVELIGGFPLNSKPEPLAEILDYEYSNADAIFVYSEAVKKSFTSRGHEDSKIFVTPIGIGQQLPTVNRPRNNHHIAFVGRGDPSKGLDVAVAAVRHLGRPFRLKVAGPMSKSVLTWLGKQDHVDYLGILNQLELRELYSTSGLMVMPSTESFGLAAAEAVHHGLRLICSTMTGIADYLSPDARRVVQGRDPLLWAQAILEELGVSSFDATADRAELLEAVSWKRATERVLVAYESLSKRHGLEVSL